MFQLKWTVLLLILDLLTSSTPMHLHNHRPSLQDSMSSESSDSTDSAETDEQVSSAAPQLIGESSYTSESDIIVRAPADFGRPNENGRSAVTVSLRDENTNVSVDVLTFVFTTESVDGRSSAADESSGLGDEGMQADESTMTRLGVTDEKNSRSDIVDGENKMGFDSSESSPNTSAIEDKVNTASVIYPPDQVTTYFNSIEALQKEMDELSDDIQADEAFIAVPHSGKAREERSGVASNGEAKQASESSMSPKPFYATDHRFDLNSEVTYQDNSTVLDSTESNSSLEDIDASNPTDSGSDNHYNSPTEDQTLSKSLDDPQSDSVELSTILITALHSLLGDLTGLRSIPAPLNLQSLTSREDTASREAKGKGAEPGSDSIDNQNVHSHSSPTSGSWTFQTVSPISSSSEEEEGDEDKSSVTDATPSHTVSPVPSPEPMVVKKGPPKSFSSGPIYVNDGWPASDYSNSLNDFRHHYAEYEEWDHTDNSIKSHHPGTPTDTNTYHETDEQDLEQGPTEENSPAYSGEATENKDLPTEVSRSEDNSQDEEQLEMVSGSPASREDVNSSSSETSRETAKQLPKAPEASPTGAGPTLSNSQESTETSEKGAITVSSSSEESVEMDSVDDQSLAPVGSNSTESQNKTDTPDWPGKQLAPDTDAQLVVQVSPDIQAATASDRQGKPVDLTPGSSSEEELDPVSTGVIFSRAPTSSEEQVSRANVDNSTEIVSTSNEEDANSSLNPAIPGNSSSEDNPNEESFSNETTDSPGTSVESTPELTLSHESLDITTEHPTVNSESVSISASLVSDEDLSSEISTPSPSADPQISGGSANSAGLAAVDANANDANNSEESQESQDLTSSTVPPVASSPSRAPRTEKSSEEDDKQDRKSDQVMASRFHSNPRPTATPQETAANPWTAFLQALKTHVTNRSVQHADHKGQRSWSNYGHHSNRGKKSSSSEESK
ncbi:dentin sialophosphoprotein-like [Colossoma macropomum]|uniref:dentin sialophosphoprotein-like n=1 Tax=Colossoma macropomum TaxID=42526 RepID=UPI001864ECD5|nr:dentin sialophosphoprotein-like [Colossoma macropomum]